MALQVTGSLDVTGSISINGTEVTPGGGGTDPGFVWSNPGSYPEAFKGNPDNYTGTPPAANAFSTLANGRGASAGNNYAQALGGSTSANGAWSTAIGYQSQAGGNEGFVYGPYNTATPNGTGIFGKNCTINSGTDLSVLVGWNSTIAGGGLFQTAFGAGCTIYGGAIFGYDIDESSTSMINVGIGHKIAFSSATANSGSNWVGHAGKWQTSQLSVQGSGNVILGTGLGDSIGTIAGSDMIMIQPDASPTANGEINIGGTFKYDGSERVTLNGVVNLPAVDPLPTGQLGDLAVSGSALYFHNGTAWGQIS